MSSLCKSIRRQLRVLQRPELLLERGANSEECGRRVFAICDNERKNSRDSGVKEIHSSMQLAAFASAASSFVASTPQPKHQRRRREQRINDAFQRTIGHLLVISHTDQRARASQASSTTSSIIRTLCLTQSLLTLLLQLSSVPMATAAPLLYCHRLDAFPRRLYATKTSYDDVRSLHDNGDISRVVWARNQTESGK